MKMEIDRQKKQPVYQQVYDILLSEVGSGLYEESGMLPSEKELCERFGIERNTVRKSLQMLVEQKLVERVPGCGTRILRREPQPVGAATPGVRRNILMLTQETNPLGSKVEYFHLKLMRMFEKYVSEMGYNLVFKALDQNGTLEEVIRYTDPAAILFDSYIENCRPHALAHEIPCVSVNHYTPHFTSVVSNNFDGAYQVAKLLTDAGHRKIALITGKSSYQTTVERQSGFQSLLLSRGLTLDKKMIFTGNWLFDSGFEIGEKILSMKAEERPTAVFAFNDDLAYGCLSCFEKHGVDVPGQISLVGFDKSDRYDGVFRRITTVDVNIDAMVQYACWYLSAGLRGNAPKTTAKIQIDTTIVDNQTVRPL